MLEEKVQILGEDRNVGGKTLDEWGFPRIIVQVSGLMRC